MNLRIGYLVNTYPRPSHSFIRREIAALERQGVTIHRFAMRDDAASLSDADDLQEMGKTEYILRLGGRKILQTLLGKGVATPQAVAAAMACARRRAAAGESSFSRQVIYMAEGAVIALRARQLGLEHIHAHFGTNSARVAAYSHMLGGPGFSFTAHGPEEFDKPEQLDLGGKVKQARFAVAVSSFGRSQLFRWADPADWHKVRVVHCGIEPDRWSQAAPMPSGPEFRMVAVGRFAEQKGFGLLIQAFAHAYRMAPQLRLSLVGDGPLRGQIEATIRSEGIAQAVDLLGWQDENGVRAALADAHVMAMPSFAEGLPVVIMEAMASGRPCIATYIAGIPELVRPGQEGWLVPAGSVDLLARTMVTAAQTPTEQLLGMSQAARQRALSRHDVNRSAEILAGLFADVAR